MRENIIRLRPLMLLLLMLLASACTTQPSNWQPEQAAPAAIPTLPSEARQPPALPWCFPTCSGGLTRERESWRQRMTEPE